MFATTIPGLAPITARELAELPGVSVDDTGFDGRSGLVLFQVARGGRAGVLSVRSTEDVFVEIGRARRSDGDRAGWIAGRIWRPDRVQRALSVWAEEVRPLSASMTFRVIARVLHERSFIRTELRRTLSDAIQRDRQRWRPADPAQIEVWISEYAPGQFVAGLRLSGAAMRQHQGRLVEREGALRPTVAAAMVRLAGEASGLLLDPCCGSGTVLSEALAVGWKPRGLDIDPEAVTIARKNVPGVEIQVGDARRSGLDDASVAACVSNLPFGHQYGVQGDSGVWLRAVLDELARVTSPGGRVILLAPGIPRSSVPRRLQIRERLPIRLLGRKTTIWAYECVGQRSMSANSSTVGDSTIRTSGSLRSHER